MYLAKKEALIFFLIIMAREIKFFKIEKQFPLLNDCKQLLSIP